MPPKVKKIKKGKVLRGDVRKEVSREDGEWTPSQQVEYFYATLVFVMKNPYHHLTWSAWKPQRFYNAVSEHISDIFGS